jgi:hypothetical protein
MILRLAENNSDRNQNDCGKLCGWACPINVKNTTGTCGVKLRTGGNK